MAGEGPFLWLTKGGPPAGFSSLPPGGMCLSVFLFVQHDGKILLGKYGDDPQWETLTGLDADRRRRHGRGWTIPASHLKFGEDPRVAARRVGEQVLRLPGLTYGEPRVEVDLYDPARAPGQPHFDLWFLVDAIPPRDFFLEGPPWYADLGWFDPKTTPPTFYARGHEDVVARWLQPPGRTQQVLRSP
ncbi:MAG: NUDIX hydrolase [Euryarchaeota archaeon]|nr:NUDIX hydrolase [Euryarchaeota archaeon]